jgi:hypothetical protein
MSLLDNEERDDANQSCHDTFISQGTFFNGGLVFLARGGVSLHLQMTYDISYKFLAIHGVMYLFSLLQGRGNVSWTNSFAFNAKFATLAIASVIKIKHLTTTQKIMIVIPVRQHQFPRDFPKQSLVA